MIRRLFYITCENCPAVSPAGLTMRAARLAARAAGFRRWNGIDRCAQCLATHLARQSATPAIAATQ